VSAQAVAVHHAATSGYVVALIIFAVLIGVIVGVIAVLDVKRKRSADPTDEAVAGAGPWYRVFLARFRSRARFVLTLDAEGAGPGGEVVAPSADPELVLRVSVGVTNASEADAGQTTMKVLVPRGCDAQWVGARTTVDPEPTTELLGVGESQVEASYLTMILPQVGRRDNPVATLTMTVRVPPRGEGAAQIPIRFRAFAEELGVGEDPVIDRVFCVRRS
jgi:hypothetical protein